MHKTNMVSFSGVWYCVNLWLQLQVKTPLEPTNVTYFYSDECNRYRAVKGVSPRGARRKVELKAPDVPDVSAAYCDEH